MAKEVDLSSNFTLTRAGAPYHIKMTFGLLNVLVRTIGDIEAVAEVSFDQELRDLVLLQVFSDRDEEGEIVGDVNLFTLDVDADEVVELLAWVGAHVTDFLLKQMTNTKKLMDKHKDQMESLMPTSTGSPD